MIMNIKNTPLLFLVRIAKVNLNSSFLTDLFYFLNICIFRRQPRSCGVEYQYQETISP